MRRYIVRQMVIVGMWVILLQGLAIRAQDTSLDLALTTEYEIGFTCPVASTQQPDTDIIWILMDNCLGNKLFLQAYDLESGAPLDTAPILLEEIDGNEFSVYPFNPLAFTSDGMLELFVGSGNTDDMARFEIDPDSGALTTDPEADEHLNTFFRQFSQYPAFTVNFSPDHTRATSSDDDGLVLYVLDLTSEEILLKIDAGYAFAAFSSDSQQIYVSVMDEPDNFDNPASTVFVYNLSDGALIQSFPLPIAVVYPSPDGRYLAFQTAPNEVGTEQLGLVEVATGRMSPLLKIGVEPRSVVTCVNSGRNVSDVGNKTTGAMWLRSVQWLPDSSGFVTVNSYGIQSSGSAANPCYFDNSRLRYYQISDS